MQIIGDRRRDRFAGLLLIVVGLVAGVLARGYELGTLAHIGPGFFPMVLSIILFGLGAAVFAMAAREGTGGIVQRNVRGWICIILAIALFVILADRAGLLPATFACVFVGATGDRQSRVLHSLILAACVSAFGVLLFAYGLHVQIPVVRGF